jgi:hypothetical protein
MSALHQTVAVNATGQDITIAAAVEGYTLSCRGADVFIIVGAAGNTVDTVTPHNQRIDSRKFTYVTTLGNVLLGARCAAGQTATLYLDVGRPGGQ